MRVTIPIHIRKVRKPRNSMKYKRKTKQNVTVMTRQYSITRVLRWSITSAKMISRPKISRWSEELKRLTIVILKSLREVPSEGRMKTEEKLYARDRDNERMARETGLFVNVSSVKVNMREA